MFCAEVTYEARRLSCAANANLPVWLDTPEPLTSTPLRRAVMAQDTGSAITGAVRADYFWGWGDDAEAQAGRMKQPLKLWVLWPKP